MQVPDYKHAASQTDKRTKLLTKIKQRKLKATRRLYVVVLLCTIFMTLQFIGGLISNSLAIMTDAAHMFTDVAGLMISIVSICISYRPSTQKLSYGYHRAQVIGALGSVLLIWGLAIFLVIQGIKRVFNPEGIDATIMLITASIGLLMNIAMMKMLHAGLNDEQKPKEVNSNGYQSLDDEDSFSEETAPSPVYMSESYKKAVGDMGIISLRPLLQVEEKEVVVLSEHEADNDSADKLKEVKATKLPYQIESLSSVSPISKVHPQLKRSHNSESVESSNSVKLVSKLEKEKKEVKGNVNVRAALIHVIGDLIQSIGVVIAAVLIMINENFVLADPICTFLCSILVFGTTIPVLKDCMMVLMEASPGEIDVVALERDLRLNTGASELHDLHVWSISVGKHSVSAHLKGEEAFKVLKRATQICQKKYNILHTTIQVQETTGPSSPNYVDCRTEIH